MVVFFQKKERKKADTLPFQLDINQEINGNNLFFSEEGKTPSRLKKN